MVGLRRGVFSKHMWFFDRWSCLAMIWKPRLNECEKRLLSNYVSIHTQLILIKITSYLPYGLNEKYNLWKSVGTLQMWMCAALRMAYIQKSLSNKYTTLFLHPASATGVIVLASSFCVCVCLSPSHGRMDRHTLLSGTRVRSDHASRILYMNGKATTRGVFKA